MKNIVLIGMSGVGKTTIGKALSKEMKRGFIDTDEIIANEAKLEIQDIFSTYGEDYFRKLESNLIDKISKDNNLIISTGGGIILNGKNIRKLKENGVIILLDASVESIVNNLKQSDTVRPLLKNEDIYNSVRNLYESRKFLYKKSSDYIISIDNKSIKQIIYEILKIYAKIS